MPKHSVAFTALLQPNKGGPPKVVVIINETEAAWLCEEPYGASDNWDLPRKRSIRLKSLWSRVDIQTGSELPTPEEEPHADD
jgi:hypothetical protein